MAINIVLSYCSDFLCMHVSFFSSPPGVFNCIYLSLSFYTALQSLPVLCGLRSWSRVWQLWSWPSGAQRVRDSCDWSMFGLLRPAVTRNGTWIYRDHQQTRAGASNEGSQRFHNHDEGPDYHKRWLALRIYANEATRPLWPLCWLVRTVGGVLNVKVLAFNQENALVE